MQIKQEKSQYLLLAIYHAAINGGQLNTNLKEIKNIFKDYFSILTANGKTPWATLQSIVRHSPLGARYFKTGPKYSILKGNITTNQYSLIALEARNRLISLNSSYNTLPQVKQTYQAVNSCIPKQINNININYITCKN